MNFYFDRFSIGFVSKFEIESILNGKNGKQHESKLDNKKG